MKRHMSVVAAAILFFSSPPLSGQEPAAPWLRGGTYRAEVTSPDSALGRPLGSVPSRYDEVVRYLNTVARQSSRARLDTTGLTHEGRPLWVMVLTSEENHSRIEEIRSSAGRLAGGASAAEARAIAAETPAIVWIGYSIHGDELSGVDAALQTCYQLAAGTDDSTMAVLHNLVVCVDPVQNPDGRERWLSQMQSWGGAVANSDAQSLSHTGMWPFGRGNHYLYDMNRDWFFLVHPESRARVRAISKWNPHVLIDAHEMGPYDTYLFSPAREALHPQISTTSRRWWNVFAGDQAKAFDRYGWSYYTREWNDSWYPGYGSAYGLFLGAVGILYEQAGVDGSVVKRPDGRTLNYRGAVHRQFVSTMANLQTAVRNRKALLEDYAAVRREGARIRQGEPAVYYCVSNGNRSRLDRLAETLVSHGITVGVTDRAATASSLVDASGTGVGTRVLPQGTLVIPMDQPMARLARAVTDFDPRMTTAFLQEEKKSLEKDGSSKLYDVTAWSLPLAFGLESYWSPDRHSGTTNPWSAAADGGKVESRSGAYGYLMDYTDDRAPVALASLLSEGLTVRAGREPLTIEGKKFVRGSVLLRTEENAAGIEEKLARVARSTGVTMYAVTTALASDGPDLGGNDFVLLREPRVAIVAGPEISTTGFGSLWFTMDQRLRLRCTVLSTALLGRADLRKYNILILPHTGDPKALSRLLGKEGTGRLRTWVESGGTLVAVGNSAVFLADTSTGISKVRLRRQVLKELDQYSRSVVLEMEAHDPVVDSLALWGGKELRPDREKDRQGGARDDKILTLEDERGRLFMPRGAILRVDLDEEFWLAFGAGKTVPALVYGSYVLLSREPVRTPARLAPAGSLRLSGLLWPEARARWASTAYTTREPLGNGQIVLYAGDPVFRSGFPGTERLLLNALLFGPGFGTRDVVDW